MQKVKFFPLNGNNKKKLYFFSANTNYISSHVLKISAISLVLRTRKIADIFNTFDEIYLVFTSKKVNILYFQKFNNKKHTLINFFSVVSAACSKSAVQSPYLIFCQFCTVRAFN